MRLGLSASTDIAVMVDSIVIRRSRASADRGKAAWKTAFRGGGGPAVYLAGFGKNRFFPAPGQPCALCFSGHGKRSVEDCQADDLAAGRVWAVLQAFWSEKQRARTVGLARFLPIARQHVSPFVGVRMGVGRNNGAGLEFAEDHDSSRVSVFMQDFQLNAVIGSGLPGFVLSHRNISKHRHRKADLCRLGKQGGGGGNDVNPLATGERAVMFQRRTIVALISAGKGQFG